MVFGLTTLKKLISLDILTRKCQVLSLMQPIKLGVCSDKLNKFPEIFKLCVVEVKVLSHGEWSHIPGIVWIVRSVTILFIVLM